MERRDRSLKALERLLYITSQDDELRAKLLSDWVKEYLNSDSIEEFDLELHELQKLSELFFTNLNFLKKHKKDIKTLLDSQKKIKQFLQ